MQKKFLITLVLLFFILAPLSAGLMSAPLPASLIQDRQVRINLVQLTFEESITHLSIIFGVQIDLSGDIDDLPLRKFSLALAQANFEQAIKEVLRKSNLQSHALIFDQKNKTVRILVLRAGTTEAKSGKIQFDRGFEGDMDPLTAEQLYLLAQLDQGPSKEDDIKPLTPEQINRLRMQSSEMEAEIEESMKPLTPEQMKHLKEQSVEPEGEREIDRQPLSKGQMHQLKEQSVEPEGEKEIDHQPLSKEQMLLLQEEQQ